MPTLELHLIEGYDDATRTRLGEVLTDALRSVIPAAAEGTIVIVHEHAPTGYFRGRKPPVPAAPLPDPKTVVRAYLDAMERRDLDAARAFLGEGFAMTFPGGVEMTTLEELVAWSKPRYARVAKSYDRFDAAAGEDGTVVTCSGTLSGAWPDGRAFDGIRFVDRFDLRGGKIVRQDVWNDIGEARLADATGG